MTKNRYGPVIASLRKEQEVSVETLANILLISPEKLLKVESGEGELSSAEIHLAAEVLYVDPEALERGMIRSPKYYDDMESKIRELHGMILALNARTKEIINEIKVSFPQAQIPPELERELLQERNLSEKRYRQPDISDEIVSAEDGAIGDGTHENREQEEMPVITEMEDELCQNTQMMHI